MSSFCQASHTLLSIHDDDLDGLNVVPTGTNLHETLTRRDIDIKLECRFISTGPGNSNSKLIVVSWKDGSDKLCGTCSFCTMLADSIQQSVKSEKWYGWNLSSKLDVKTLSHPFDMRAVIHLLTLEYEKHSKPQTVDKQNPTYWDVSLLLLDGFVEIYPETTSIGNYGKVYVVVPLAFELFAEEGDPIAELLGIHRRPFHGPRLSDENITKVHHWMEHCVKNHDRCAVNQADFQETATFIPTRIVDVGGTMENEHPRLIITSELATKAPEDEAIKYIALSYCWGKQDSGNKLLKTTNNTIHARTKKIEITTMPPTFQDAIAVARRLGFRYIWIDSLCIIQDDVCDWQIQSSRMAEIFSNAYLTLIVATGSGCNDSFLDRGLPGLSCIVPLTLKERQGLFSLRFRPHRGPYDKMSEIRGSKWIDRGWTFQEERLAKRCLIFGERKFFFDCRSVEKSQDTARYLARPEWVTSVTEGLGESREVSTKLIRHWDHWHTLCAQYSYRELSFPEDKLPAISGMANKIGKKVKSGYLAGLWKENLIHDLFWNTIEARSPKNQPVKPQMYRAPWWSWSSDGKIKRPVKPQRYRAPSWSWASVDGKINWPLHCGLAAQGACTLYCTIIDVKTTLFGLDPYGAVKDGFIKVQGVVLEVAICRSRELLPWTFHQQGVEGIADLDIEELFQSEKSYHALLMVGCQEHGDSAGDLIRRGLLLERTGRQREGNDEFERVGTFTLKPDGMPDQKGNEHVWGKGEEQVIVITPEPMTC